MREINQENKVLLREAVTGRRCIQQTTGSRIQRHEFVFEEGSREKYTHGNQSSHISSYRYTALHFGEGGDFKLQSVA